MYWIIPIGVRNLLVISIEPKFLVNSRGPTINIFFHEPAPKLGASRNMGAIFLGKKAPAAT